MPRIAQKTHAQVNQEFLEKWKKEIMILRMQIEILRTHATTMVSQYRRIKKMKEVIASSENKAKFIQIDWSENVALHETRLEKSQYLYIPITRSVNTTILYEQSKTTSHGTISDGKSHGA